jgi:hypothetical protein
MVIETKLRLYILQVQIETSDGRHEWLDLVTFLNWGLQGLR